MRSCNCSGGTSSGLSVVAGDGIAISGSGTPTDPLMISSLTTDLAGLLLVQDTNTVDLNLSGSGAPADPFTLSAVANVSMMELSDVFDPAGPAVGEGPVWAGDHFVFAPPPAVAPGQVTASGGLTGDGTVGTPLKIAVSSTATTALTGAATYIDSAGQLRVIPGAADWNTIANKPTQFPSEWSIVANKPATYPDAAKISGHKVFVQPTTPSGMILDDIWIKKAA